MRQELISCHLRLQRSRVALLQRRSGSHALAREDRAIGSVELSDFAKPRAGVGDQKMLCLPAVLRDTAA